MRWVILLSLAAAVPAAAQNRFPPDSLVNVKVLPKTMPVRAVVDLMRNFTFALGERCTYCHVGEEGQPLGSYDFASDERRTKQVAREMLKMVTAINEQTIAHLPARTDTGLRVTCNTCHRGVARPVPLERLVGQAVAAGGVDSAARVYRALRERHYGSDAYDFSEQTLVSAATALAQQRQFDPALALLGLDGEFYPRGAGWMFASGEVHRAKGDTAAAIQAYRETLARDPQHGGARQRLRQLGAP